MEVEKLFKQFQLGNSVFRGQWRMTKDMVGHNQIPKAEIEAMAVREMTIQLAEKVLKDHEQSITKEEKENYNQFNVELLIISKGQFKSVVEAAISLMTDEQIAKIKVG